MRSASSSFFGSLALSLDLVSDGLRSPMFRALMTFNFLLIAIHLIVASSPNEDVESWTGFLRIDRDRSVSEWFESIEMTVAIILLVTHARRHQEATCMMMAGLIALMVVDNLFELRERVALLWSPEGQALAEILLAVAAAPFLVGFAYFAYRRAGQTERSELTAMLSVCAVFAMFAVVIDFLHELVSVSGSTVYAALSVVEDGGELIALSLLLAVVFQLRAHTSITESKGGLSHHRYF